MECILRLALTDNGDRWEPGTVLSVHKIEEQETEFSSGEKRGFFVIAAKSDKYSFNEILTTWRCRKVVSLDTILSPASLNSRLLVKSTGSGYEEPRWDKEIDLDVEGRVRDSLPKYMRVVSIKDSV